MAKSLEEAVKIAKKVTQKKSICVLSPAASSYGYFKNFEERGNLYKRFVLEDDIKMTTNKIILPIDVGTWRIECLFQQT